MKKSSNDNFLIQIGALSENIINCVKNDGIFTQIMIFLIKNIENLRAKEKEGEKKKQKIRA